MKVLIFLSYDVFVHIALEESGYATNRKSVVPGSRIAIMQLLTPMHGTELNNNDTSDWCNTLDNFIIIVRGS